MPKIDLSGQVFVDWQVLELVGSRDNKAWFLCECSICGFRKEIAGRRLREGNSRYHCSRKLKQLKDISGLRSGRTVALGFSHVEGRGKQQHAIWLCLCDCGNYHSARSYQIIQKVSKSCGCLNSELVRERFKIWQPNATKRRIKALKSKTLCDRGHEWLPQNTIIGSDGDRRCRICRRAASRIWSTSTTKGISHRLFAERTRQRKRIDREEEKLWQ